MSKRLGRGLEAIIDTRGGTTPIFVVIRTEQIRPNRFQPRTNFSQHEMEGLKASIRHQGVLQPVIVRPIAHGTYELVAGERRWRAAQALNLTEIPAIVKTLGDREALEYSLIENVQRQDLDPMEEASGYRRLADDFGHTQEEIATRVGKDRATVANALRLLKLPQPIQEALRSGAISMGHARALLAIEGATRQLEWLERTRREQLSVRQLESLIATAQPSRRRRTRQVDPQVAALEERLRQALGTKVKIASRKKGGRLVIEYFSSEDLERILQVLGVSAT